MQKMLAALQKEMSDGRASVLVTLTAVEGSAPRGTGSQMLVGAAGRLSGTIGGGAIELQSVTLAQSLLPGGCSAVRRFALHPDTKDSIGMVCGGSVSAHFQFIPADSAPWRNAAECISGLLAAHRGGRLILRESGGDPALAADGALLSGEVPDELLPLLCSDGLQQKNGYLSVPFSAGTRAVIFGAGHVAQSLCPLLRSVDFRPIIFDERPDLAVRELFPDAEEVICGSFTRIEEKLTLLPDDYIAVMTNGHTHDFTVEEQVLQRPFAYLGVIGSQRKTAITNEKLPARGFSAELLAAVHAPIGTAIRAVTPAELAVSIAGEMIYERALLRERAGDGEKHNCPMH